ncbi:MAG: hypothetical protein K2K94_06045, partial [Muribaculaceae bacterium]|nr:hypothetical protein [Muribaculaceae bacterium]
ERQEIVKQAKKDLNQKASKDARKEAKRLEKDGWKAAPGSLPIVRQLDRAYVMQNEYGSDCLPKFFHSDGMATSHTFEAAKTQATELARQRLAGQIQSEATAIVENSVANNQISAEEAETITKTILTGQTLSSQTIGRIIPVVELYRDLPNGKKEVRITIFYDAVTARNMALKAASEELEAQANSKK